MSSLGTNYPEIFEALAAPFAREEVKSRPGSQGRQLSYVTATTVSNRLDPVLGPEGWDFEVTPWDNMALIGTLTIRLPDGVVIRKSNVGGKAGMQAADDDAKSAASDCLKRCAALVGVARYLYADGTPDYGQGSTATAPAPQHRPQPPQPRANGESAQRSGDGEKEYGPPRSGKGLFAWCKETEKKYDVGMLKYLNGWAKLQDFPGRMVDWDDDQVAQAYAEGMRKLQTVVPAATVAPEPEPTSRPLDTDETRRTARDILKAQRNKLNELVWKIARHNASKPEPEPIQDTWYWRALDEVQSSPSPTLAKIAHVADCEDTDLLRSYIDAAYELLDARKV
jgi:hypothetical protein